MHGHSHDFRTAETRRVTLVGAVLNLVLAAVKVIVGIIGQSQSLIADGIHSLSDLFSDGLVLFAATHAASAPDDDHPYGHARFETAATLGLGILLIAVAIGIVWDAVARLFSPEALLQPQMMTLYVAAFSIFSKEALYWYTVKAAERINSPMLRANAWHHRSDAISSIVVLVGIAGTMAGLPYLDAIAAVLVGLMVARIGWELGFGALQELVDAGLEQQKVEQLRNAILAIDDVRNVHMLRTRRHGHLAAADVHVQVDPWLSVSEGHMISVAVEKAARNALEELVDVTVHIDPEDDEESPPSSIGLPTRSEALDILEQAWVTTGCDGRWEQVQLHYLQGKIHVHVYLALSCLDEMGDAETIARHFSTPLEALPEFGKVTIYYSHDK